MRIVRCNFDMHDLGAVEHEGRYGVRMRSSAVGAGSSAASSGVGAMSAGQCACQFETHTSALANAPVVQVQ